MAPRPRSSLRLNGRGWAFAASLVLAVLVAVPALAAATFPKLTGRVVDEAHILPAAVAADLTTKLEGLEQSTGRQLVVVTVPSLQGYEIEDYGYQLGRAWGIGDKKENNGALFIVAPTERKVRIEVGYGLEPVLTDALSSVILQTQVLPRFKAGDMQGGVVSGVDAVIAQLGLPEDQAKANVAKAAQAGGDDLSAADTIVLVIVTTIFFVVLSLISMRRGRRRGGRGGGWDIFWFLMGAFTGWSSGGDRGGWGGGGGGGFSGGGGSFGGGGSSGSW